MLVLGALLTLACAYPIPAHAVPPAPDRLVKLDDRLLKTSRARITTLSVVIVAEGVRVSAEGLAYHDIHRAKGDTRPPAPGRIPWDAVVRVDVPSNHALPAALWTGLVVGIVTGAATYAAGQRGEEGGPGSMFLIPIATIVAAGVGALIPAWHPIYRAPHTSAVAK
jgi:hypothetical protein